MNSFGNIITQTITQTNDAKFFVGQAFSGYFQYDSTDADGTFYLANNLSPSGNRSLKGVIYLPFPQDQARQNSLPITMNDGYLKVAGGVVVEFAWTIQTGDYYAGFSETAFYARLMNRINPQTGESLPDIETSGTVAIAVPLRQS